MQHPRYMSAQDALDRLVLTTGARSLPVACRCGDTRAGALTLVRDRDEIDGEVYDTVIEARWQGEGPVVLDCDACGTALAPDTVYERGAVEALRRAVTDGISEVPVACAGCGYDAAGTLVLADAGHREVGYPGRCIGVETDDPELSLVQCPVCEDDLAPRFVVLRDRHRRCVSEIAELRAVA